MKGRRLEVPVFHVFGTRPEELHRPAVDGLGDLRGLERVIPSEAAAEASAHQRDVHLDVLGRHAEERGDAVLHVVGRLRR